MTLDVVVWVYCGSSCKVIEGDWGKLLNSCFLIAFHIVWKYSLGYCISSMSQHLLEVETGWTSKMIYFVTTYNCICCKLLVINICICYTLLLLPSGIGSEISMKLSLNDRDLTCSAYCVRHSPTITFIIIMSYRFGNWHKIILLEL